MSEEATLDEFTDDTQSVLLNPITLEIPKEWGFTSIDSISTLVSDGAHQTPEYVDSGVRFLSTKNLQPGADTFDFEDYEKYITREKHLKLCERVEPTNGDILISKSGTIGITQLVRSDLEFSIFVGLGLIRPNKQINNVFLEQILNWNQLRKSMRARSPGSTRSTLPIFAIKELEIPLPPFPEQRKIATVLYTIDRAIENTERIVDQMDTVQRGLLRSPFGKDKQGRDTDIETKTERLGPKQFEVPITWEVTNIASIGRVVTGDTPSTDDESNFGGKLPFVTPSTLSQGKYVTESDRTLSETGRNEAKPVPKGSVMMDCIGSDMGKVAISGCEVATNQQINSVVIGDASYLPEFLYYHLIVLSDFIKSQAGQTATPIVNKSSFESFVVFDPPIEEQQEIVDTLSFYDEGKRSNIECLRELKRLKRGLQQDLLSGTVRTTDTNIEVPDEIAQHG